MIIFPKRSHHGYHRFPHWNWQLSGKSHFQTHPDIPYVLVFCPWHSHFLSIESPCYLHSTRWCPPVISWFIIPLTIDISTISPSEIRVINQLSYLGGTTLYMPLAYSWSFPSDPTDGFCGRKFDARAFPFSSWNGIKAACLRLNIWVLLQTSGLVSLWVAIQSYKASKLSYAVGMSKSLRTMCLGAWHGCARETAYWYRICIIISLYSIPLVNHNIIRWRCKT